MGTHPSKTQMLYLSYVYPADVTFNLRICQFFSLYFSDASILVIAAQIFLSWFECKMTLVRIILESFRFRNNRQYLS